jgi:glycosyltransferase involved in cell wall biosynthesis
MDELLDALAGQTLGRDAIEILIADDGSTDGSVAAAARRGELLRLRVLSDEPKNSYAARNRGAAHAEAPVLAFCDGDCVPEPAWLEQGLAALEQFDLAAGMIRLTVPEPRSIWHLLDVDTFLDQERAVRAGAAATANLFVRKSVFDAVRGFDDTLPNQGDHDFVGRAVAAGYSLGFAPEAAVVHPTRDRQSFMKKLWAVDRRYGTRCARNGTRPEALKLRSLVPLVQPLRSRRRFGRTFTLDRKRLAESGVRPTRSELLRALPLQYLFLPYHGSVAQAAGWLEGRRR